MHGGGAALHGGREQHGAPRPVGSHRPLVDRPRLARREVRERPVERDGTAAGQRLGTRAALHNVLGTRHRGELEAKQRLRQAGTLGGRVC
jgi:hypothetical protein